MKSPLLFFSAALVCAALLTGCAPATQMTVLVKMIKDQENYFRDVEIAKYNKVYHAKVNVVGYNNTDSIEYELDARKGNVDLIKVPFDRSAALVREKRIAALDDVLPYRNIRQLSDEKLLTSLGKFDGKFYYIPRKFETRIMVYRKSKVADALQSWRKYKPGADSALKAIHGTGLPASYALESDPNQWDFFDLFVVGWVWSHVPYDGMLTGRIAHRSSRYSGTSLGLVDQVFQCGGDSTAVLTMSGDAVADAFYWEALYAHAGIFNPRMVKEGWSGGAIWNEFKQGTVFLSTMTQLDCFFIHGTGRDGLEGYLSDPDDMGVAVMAAGSSVELNKNGEIVRQGSRSITTGGWWWGIPADASNPTLSYQLASYITNTENQVQECNRFGMIPVRKDILSDMSMMFGGEWIKGVYEASFKQLVYNKGTIIPTNPHYTEISVLYLDAWKDIIVNQDWSADQKKPDRAYIKKVLETAYTTQAREILRR
jgi:ABC-type glycerol-3-phosphate transport system substrate-binding protein